MTETAAATSGRALWLLLLLFLGLPVAASDNAPVVLQVFVRDGCPHCAEAKTFLPQLVRDYPHVTIELRRVDADPQAYADLITYSQQAGIWPPGVPAFVVGQQMLVGFGSPDVSGEQLRAMIEYRGDSATGLKLPVIGNVDFNQLGLPLFTVAIGLVDGFNPCAMWVLLFLLSLLVHLQSRRRMAMIAGTFVVTSGVVYFLFMAAWLNVFQWLGMGNTLWLVLGAVAIILGGINLREFFVRQPEFLLSIPGRAKPGLYARMRKIIYTRRLFPALLGVTLLAILVNGIELLCTAGFPAIYNAILSQQALTTSAYYGYLGLYILAYMADDAVMVTAAVVALSSQKLSQNAGRWLKALSGGVMLLLGLLMLFKPDWLI